MNALNTKPLNVQHLNVEHLNVEHLSVVWQSSRRSAPVPILHDCTCRFAASQITAIVGPNGAGKSTLLRSISGIERSGYRQTGTVTLGDTAVADMDSKTRARTIAWLEQAAQTSTENICVYDIVMLGRLPYLSLLGTPSAFDHQVVERALHTTQAWAWRHRPIQQLSGGERQRVLLARALAVESDVLLMDEPLASLDPPHQAECMLLARRLAQQDKTVVMVLHELNFALLCDHIVVMQAGRIVHSGSAHDAQTHRTLESVFEHRIRIQPIAHEDRDNKNNTNGSTSNPRYIAIPTLS